MRLSNYEAWLFAASWGSYMNDGDPGACFYGFDERFLVQSEGHRKACLKHVEHCKARILSDPDRYDEDEMEQMEALVVAFQEAKIEGVE